MTLKQIEYFQMVCKCGNISNAAKELFVSRSVVSRALSELEDEFETQIFTRTQTGVELTESGKILARLFDEFVACYSTTKEWIRKAEENANSAVLRLGVTPTNAYQVNKLYLNPFTEKYPEVQLYIDEYSAYDAWSLISRGEVDAFFTPARSQGLEMVDSIALYQTGIVLGMASGDPIAEKDTLSVYDLVDLPLACLKAPMPLEGMLESGFGAFGKKPKVVLRTTDKKLLRDMTLKGAVYAILPSDMIKSWTGIVGVPIQFFFSSTHRMLWSKALPHKAALDAFIDYMRQFELK